MDYEVIHIDPSTARAKRDEYRAAVHDAGQVEVRDYETRAERRRLEIVEQDKALAAFYASMVKGHDVIDVRATIRNAGLDAQGRPRLALARADERAIEVSVFMSGRVDFDPLVDHSRENRARSDTRCFSFLDLFERGHSANGQATVPHIPPHLRPANLAAYHLLWEAEWQRVQPRDPILLRHVAAGLYTVVAAWDLTPLEASILQSL